jgi:hypothetical protein
MIQKGRGSWAAYMRDAKHEMPASLLRQISVWKWVGEFIADTLRDRKLWYWIVLQKMGVTPRNEKGATTFVAPSTSQLG